MKCQVCGKEIDKHYVLYSDGLKKIIALCDRCKVRVIKDSLPLSKPGLRLLLAHSFIVQEAMISKKVEVGGGRDEVFVKMPPAVLRVLFKKDDLTDSRTLKEIYQREIALLQRKLEDAIKNEDYKKAGKIRDKIRSLREKIERK